MQIQAEIEAFHDEMTQWRRDIHQHPELGFVEHRTSEVVAGKLQSFGLKVHQGLATTGVVGTIRNGDGPSIGMRADLDALPLPELNEFEYKSVNEGRMHACGHDGHTTMLLGAAKYLAATKRFRGTVHCIFQPAEEGGGGGDVMVKEGLFEQFPVDAVYGMHNMPGLPKGVIGSWPGPMLAAADTFELVVQGKGGHAAMPDHAIDPVVIGVQVVNAFQTIASRRTAPLDSIVVSTTRFNAGEAFNVIPDSVTIGGSVRTFKLETRDVTAVRLQQIAEGICAANGATCTFTYHRGYPATVNHAEQTQIALRAAGSVVGEENLLRDPNPIMASEDFSFMLLARPGCFVFIGNGVGEAGGCMVHNPHYDFNDDILPIGASYWATLVEQELPL
ncbi:MAG: M20 aminoacylase family protein [SAR324 cluster bacterium]|nr:M20 aminoacylase family protein [SAR324 cluster bacterium]